MYFIHLVDKQWQKTVKEQKLLSVRELRKKMRRNRGGKRIKKDPAKSRAEREGKVMRKMKTGKNRKMMKKVWKEISWKRERNQGRITLFKNRRAILQT